MYIQRLVGAKIGWSYMSTKSNIVASRVVRGLVAGVCGVAASLCLFAPTGAEAWEMDRGANTMSTVTIENTSTSAKTVIYCDGAEDLMSGVNAMKAAGDQVTIDLEGDLNTSGFGVLKFDDSSKHFVLNLHGHMINREYENYVDGKYKGGSNGEVIRVCKGVTLDVVGSSTDDEAACAHPGTFVDDGSAQGQKGTFWRYKRTGFDAITGGLITGGGCDDHLGGGGFTVQNNATLNLKNVTVAGNVADTYCSYYGCGGGVAAAGKSCVNMEASHIDYNHANGWGGGVYLDMKATLTMKNASTVNHNKSAKYGGGVAADPAWADGQDTRSLMMYGGSQVDYNIAEKDGGGVYVGGTLSQEFSIELYEKSEISHNATNGSGGAIAYNTGDNGQNGATLLLNDSSLEYNSCGGKGGAIWFGGDGSPFCAEDEPMFMNSSISYNTAAGDGGAISFDHNYPWHSHEMHLGINLTFEGNTSGGKGGALAIGSPLDIKQIDFGVGTVFKNNTAASDGGAIWLDCDISFATRGIDVGSYNQGGLTFEGNVSTGGFGGAVYSKNNKATIALFGSNKTVFKNNKAKSGGALYIRDHSSDYALNVNNAEFTGNAATDGSGGAIWVDKELTIQNTSITGNTATEQGGGVFNCNSSYYAFTLKGTITIEGNKSGSSNNNLAMMGNQTVCGGSGDEALAADSRIGVTICDYTSGRRRISGNEGFVTEKVNDSWTSCVYSDNQNYSVVRDGDFLYLQDAKTSKYDLTLIAASADEGEDTQTTVSEYDVNSTVTVDAADYPKNPTSAGDDSVDWELTSWTLTMGGKSTTLTPDESGNVSFQITSPATLRANYSCYIKSIGIKLTDTYSFDSLATTDAPESGDTPVVKNSLSLTGNDGVSHTHEADTDMTVVKRTVVANGDEKDVTYTVRIPASALSADSLIASEAKGAPTTGVNVSFTGYNTSGAAAIGNVSSTDVSNYTVESDGSVQMDVTLKVTNASKKYAVTFKADGKNGNGRFPDGSTTQVVYVQTGTSLAENDDFNALSNPICNAYTKFAHWADDKSTDAWNLNTPIASDVTLSAAFVEVDSGSYTVAFTTSDGALLDRVTVAKGATAKAPTGFDKEGNEIEGWYTSDDFAAVNEWNFETPVTQDVVDENGELTLYGKYEQVQQWVTFDTAGGTTDDQTKLTVNYGETLDEYYFPVVTREGYTLDGWYLNGVKFDPATTITTDITLTAGWSINTYKVTFDTGAGASKVESSTAAYGDYVTRPADPRRSGYTFKGWYTDKACSEGKEFDFAKTKIKEDTTLYAKWVDAYTIRFKYDDGATEDTIATVTSGDTLESVLFVPSRDHYNFKGWFDEDGNQVDSDTVAKANMTLTAKWSAQNVFVNYYCGKTLLHTDAVPYGETPDVSGATTIANEYAEQNDSKFEGWFDGSDLANAYTPQVVTDTVNVYGKLTANAKIYQVTFATGDGATTVDSQSVESGSHANEPAAPTREGYTFDGWYADEECTKEFDFDSVSIEKDTTVYAKWTKNITIAFDVQGGTPELQPWTIKKGSAIGSLPRVSKKNHAFQGWIALHDGALELVNADTTFDEDVTLMAVLTEGGHSVTLMDGSSVWTSTYTDSEGHVVLPDTPKKAGYTFEGWYTDKACSDGKEWKTSDTTDEDLTLYAKWKAEQVTLTTYMNGEKLDDLKVDFGSYLEKPEFIVPDGYTFSGWYADKDLVNEFDFTTPITEDTSIYCEVRDGNKEFTVTFESNGGSKVDSQKVKDGSVATEPEAPTREGYTFGGWYTDKKCTDGNEFDFAKTKIEADTTLYAKWTEVEPEPSERHVVTFRDGDTVVDVCNVADGEAVVRPADPEKEGYIFEGWTLDGEDYDFSAPVTADMTLDAKWSKSGDGEPSDDDPDKGDDSADDGTDPDGSDSDGEEPSKDGSSKEEPAKKSSAKDSDGAKSVLPKTGDDAAPAAAVAFVAGCTVLGAAAAVRRRNG